MAANREGPWFFGFHYLKRHDKMIAIINYIFDLDISDFVTAARSINSKNRRNLKTKSYNNKKKV